MRGRNIVNLIFWVLFCQLTGLVGSIFTRSGLETWYPALEKPSFNPPNWLFGPVWAVLYTLMGIAAFLVSRKYGEKPRVAVTVQLFIIHLFFNASFFLQFFLPAIHASGIDQYPGCTGFYNNTPAAVFQDIKGSRLAYGALPALGSFCYCSKRWALAA